MSKDVAFLVVMAGSVCSFVYLIGAVVHGCYLSDLKVRPDACFARAIAWPLSLAWSVSITRHTRCSACNAKTRGQFCPNCGRKVQDK